MCKVSNDRRHFDRQTCESKTATGNVYASAAAARKVAQRMKRKHGGPISHYPCPHCRKFHVGGRWR